MSEKSAAAIGLQNPYVGPRPFSKDDAGRFFGRDREARDLIPLVIAERLVLFYAQSGAGKSSLINARLIPGLQERNFIVLPVARVSGQAEENQHFDNPFIYNLLRSLEGPSGRESTRLAGMTLPAYLADLDMVVPVAAVPGGDGKSTELLPEATAILDAPQVVQGVQPLAIIVDQFEEIFTTYPGSWKSREPFFLQLCEALEADPLLWVILVMREDYVAGLDPYLYLLPNRLRARYYMQRMSYESALEAVKKPAGLAGKTYDSGVAEDLVNNLRRVVTGENENGEPIYAEGQFVEPVQLQVVCYQLWEELKNDAGNTITAKDLERLAKGKDLAEFISSALADFYNSAIENTLQAYPQISERQLRDFFSKKLITESGTRGLVFRGDESTEGLPNQVLYLLENRFIIRAEKRGAGTWYEIVHDRFVDPILRANLEWSVRNPRPFQAEFDAWIQSGKKDRSKYLEGRQLAESVQLLESHSTDFSEDEKQFIQSSRAASEEQKSRGQRRLIVTFLILALVFAGLAAFSAIQSNQANQQRAIANSALGTQVQQAATISSGSTLVSLQKQTADFFGQAQEQLRKTAEAAGTAEGLQRSTAVAANTAVSAQRDSAVTAEVAAKQAQATAQVAKQAADIANQQSQASRLASLSDYFRDKKLDLSLLLAVEAVKINDNWSTRQALLNSLQRGISTQLEKDGQTLFLNDVPYGFSFSNSGDLMAAGLADGTLKTFFAEGRGKGPAIPTNFNTSTEIRTVSFSPKDDSLAAGSVGGLVQIWNISSGKIIQFQPFAAKYTFAPIRAVAFQPGGSLLAVATQVESSTKQGHLFLFDYQSEKVAFDTDCGQTDCSSLAWTQDGSRLAFGTGDGTVKVLDAATKKEVQTLSKVHRALVSSLVWDREGKHLVSGGLDKQIILWDIANGNALARSQPDLTPVVVSMSMSPSGRYLVVGSNDPVDRLTVWQLDSLERKNFPALQLGHTQAVNVVSFSPRGDLFASASSDQSIIFWRFRPINSLATEVFSVQKGIVDGLTLDSTGSPLAAQRVNNNQMNLLTKDQKNGVSVNQTYSTLAFGNFKGQPVIALGDLNGKVTLLDSTSGKTIQEIPLAKLPLDNIALSEKGNLLAAASCNQPGNCRNLILWNLDTQKPEVLKGVLGDAKGDLSAVKLDSNARLGGINSLAFNQDGSQLAISTRNLTTGENSILLYGTADGSLNPVVTEGLNLGGGNVWVNSLAFSPVEAGLSGLLAAGFSNGQVALWDAGTRLPVGLFADPMNSEITGLVFRKDPTSGEWLLYSSSSRGDVWQWQVDMSSWTERACSFANRTLTSDEKGKFLPAGYQNDNPCPAFK